MDVPLLLVALIAGMLLPLGLSGLPPLWLAAAPLVLGAALWRRSQWRWLGALGVGLLWSCFIHSQLLAQRLPPELDGVRTEIVARIQGLPEATETGWRLALTDARLVADDQTLPPLRAHWFDGQPTNPGELWRFEITLRRPAGMANPGGFDYEAWLYAQGVGALGSIRHGERLAEAPRFAGFAALRQEIRSRMTTALAEQAGGARLIALVVGDKSVLDRDDWLVLQATGTAHLMVISGLHVGMLAAAVFGLVMLLGRLGLVNWPWPRLWLATVLVIPIAAIYALLAGFGVPVQRALLMISLGLLVQLVYRRPRLWTLWLLAFAAVVAGNPGGPLRAGFWLSFMAVGLLLYGMGARLGSASLWWRWGRAQWVVFVGLWPWLMWWNMPASLSAPLANVLAIPWVSLLVVPAALLGTVLELLFDFPWLLKGAAVTLNALFEGLDWLAQWRGAERLPTPSWSGFLLGLAGVAALLSPLARLLWVPAMACLLALLMPFHERPAAGQLWVTVLDVGQGLSVLLQTEHHDLLYDTGARFSSGFDLGEAVVHPALLALGVRKLDVMLISHADNDHAGGAPFIAAHLPVGQTLAGQHAAIDPLLQAQPCMPGDSWQWDGVRFEILYSQPPPAPPNEQSCVLRAVAGDTAVLLPGDLGVSSEYQMLDQMLRADLLLAPHHGSRSSSSYAFIRAVQPRWSVFSAGRHSPYGHPHPLVVARYRELEAEPVYTATAGAIRFVLDDAGKARREWSWRERARRFWHEDQATGRLAEQLSGPVLE
ncbi:DNA internalization-like competence protein ComEC/Rec2 [Pseudomonas saudimassiliensis]|uniref:DNA internalization-like competence protein ComEC/Rec2 n=1 Tax=Pseudomonas saudimassiliensis TaxID=1461581 RepID=A0A078MGT3_9PSED|nr:DNA internalization-related competence protein ComEC/Rec2 [Pseudomonas saudimassiliensis]CEA05505.1 DNA internalization-like competence protein ComEC/Rec2 [Pseudomonas saudimassiliensis]CEF27173.1 DNA internalization-like competence protein ComEC/Rec2 [Pseudomonas saudimassiliensis]